MKYVYLAAAIALILATGCVHDFNSYVEEQKKSLNSKIGQILTPSSKTQQGASDSNEGHDSVDGGQIAFLSNQEDEWVREWKIGVLEGHNRIRSEVSNSRTSTPLPKLIWSSELEKTATEIASKCDIFVDRTDVKGYTGEIGSNFYASTAGAHLSISLSTWELGKDSYDNATNTCQPRSLGDCMPYIQMIARQVTAIGCAIHTCSSYRRLDWDGGQTAVCYYDFKVDVDKNGLTNLK